MSHKRYFEMQITLLGEITFAEYSSHCAVMLILLVTAFHFTTCEMSPQGLAPFTSQTRDMPPPELSLPTSQHVKCHQKGQALRHDVESFRHDLSFVTHYRTQGRFGRDRRDKSSFGKSVRGISAGLMDTSDRSMLNGPGFPKNLLGSGSTIKSPRH
jgi:hypothetical protein